MTFIKGILCLFSNLAVVTMDIKTEVKSMDKMLEIVKEEEFFDEPFDQNISVEGSEVCLYKNFYYILVSMFVLLKSFTEILLQGK